MNPVFELRNGVLIPQIGFGTWQIRNPHDIKESLRIALDTGYRHIDTAQIYGNEALIGEALQELNVPREELFITSKVWNTSQGYDQTMLAFEETLRKLQTNYLDLYLIHWPAVNLHQDYKTMNRETYRAMESLYNQGKTRAIGVSNFYVHHLEALLPHVEITPMVNQIEFHPGNPMPDVVSFCQARGILVEAYSPMMKGKVFQLPLLQEIAQKYHRTIPQIVLRWILDQGVLPLSKSITKERIVQNFDVFDFTLSKEDQEVIATLQSMGRVGTHPDVANY